MSLSNASASTANDFSTNASVVSREVAMPSQSNQSGFVDRRREPAPGDSGERRQFGSSHDGLSVEGRELALAIDQYKLQHHRRYITCDEMLMVITKLGYSK